MFDTAAFFRAVIEQDADTLRTFFWPSAHIEWPCTNERFSLEEYIRANCEYPGCWRGRVEKLLWNDEGFVMVSRVEPADQSSSFHAVSFVTLCEGKIKYMEEFWADDGSAPRWRQEMKIGAPIR